MTFLLSCSDTQPSDKEVEQRAYEIIEQLDKSKIETFRHWGYGTRGEANIWSKLDTPAYDCFYFNTDTLKLSVGLIENFKTDFPYSITIDTSRIHQITFTKLNDEEINITAWINFGKDTTLFDTINFRSVFPTSDPFQYFTRLSKLKDSLQIIGTFYRPDIGNFIQFYLTNQHVLTYFPDTLEINPKFKDVWMEYFSTGINLSKNWNLRKLEQPLDNG
ncbi:MAG TPA: hypothetical protein PKE30_06830 [Niabella sp.]|nr:hypothetical protein [Niabella sp.]